MNLKKANQAGKIEQFIRERENTRPASRRRFNRLVKSMISQNAKPTRGTSRKGSRES